MTLADHYKREICELLGVQSFDLAIPALKFRRIVPSSSNGLANTPADEWDPGSMSNEDAERIIHHLRADREREREKAERYDRMMENFRRYESTR